MKTIAFNGNNRNFTRALFVLAALGGLYYLRRSGRSVSDLVTTGKSGLKQVRGFISRVAPSTQATESVAAGAQI